jgi:hypothetical protein
MLLPAQNSMPTHAIVYGDKARRMIADRNPACVDGGSPDPVASIGLPCPHVVLRA